MSTGIVYLIGAGPGDPELITVKGLKCLHQADVVVYDRLVNPALLDEAPPWADLVYAGKASGHHAMSQDEINALLIDRAKAGQTVARLKGGDPFVFGRGGEEALACAEAGVRWEVVPGITSAVGVSGRAGIPLTHRGIAGSFAVVTGHQAATQNEPDWSGLTGADTLVVLMGVENLPYIVEQLIVHGRAATTPIAIIERGTHPDERVLTGTLETITQQALEADIAPPACLVIGEVVRLRESIRSFTSLAQV